jgi:hypothetical protein
MRETVSFEVRLRRFDVWQLAVAVVASIAVAGVVAWAVALLDSQTPSAGAGVVGLAAALAVATVAVALSLARVEGGLLACRDGAWTFVTDAGTIRTGALEVAIDLGAFVLIRLGDRRRSSLWLPLQCRGLEPQWHGLRCAVYSPPPAARASFSRPFE